MPVQVRPSAPALALASGFTSVLSEEDRRKIVEWAKRHPVIERVYLYGSRARGEERSDSDIDLAIEMPYVEWFEWHSAYKEKPDLHLSHAVDLQWYKPNEGLEKVGTGVERDGVLLYEGDSELS
jgi:predicted nucleotidyltransferase